MESYDKDIVECAVRELKEETGVNLSPDIVKEQGKPYHIHRATYYYLPYTEQDTMIDNGSDATGITWMRLDCLKQMHDMNEILLNYQCKELLYKIFKMKFKTEL